MSRARTCTGFPRHSGRKTRLACAALALWLGACESTKPEDKGPEAHFQLSDTLAGMIQIDTVHNTNVKGDLRLTGKITFNEDKVLKVYPLVGGSVAEVKAELGDYVEKGQILAVIKSGEIAGYEQQKIAAEADAQIAARALESVEEMHASGVSSDKDLITAQRESAKAEAELHRIKEIFAIYGIRNGSEYLVKSPISGFIAERKINNGMQIRADNSDNIFTISNLEEVWVTANIYETDIAKVKADYDAEVSTLSYEGKVFTGKVDKVSNILDPETKAMQVRIRLANPGFLLKPEMFASVVIHYQESDSLPEIPAQSVIFDKSKNFVMLYKDKANLETREVSLYKTVAGRAYIKEGLKEGDRVISRYHLLVYDEMNGG